MFPEQVVEGFVIPFGLFRAHMEQAIPGRDISYWQFLQQGFAKAKKEREAGQSEASIEANLLAHLAELRKELETIPFLPGFKAEFRDSFAQIFGTPLGELPVFLRSDTNMEDLKDFTGAGLNKTIFNVREEEKIWDGIREVWMSPYTERSFKWRQRYLNNPENVYPSLLVIPGVNVDYSGVVITQNVSTGRTEDITAAFSRGVGGAVDGQRAETYTIFETGHIAMLSPAREVNYLYLPAEGGTKRGIDKLNKPLLNLYNLTDIKYLTDEVEANYPREEGTEPITYDMEMGFKDDHLWLFQVRPFVENKQAAASGYLQSINPSYEPYKSVDLSQKI
jgi:phosphoenolpyruvate synthase/pyruvate phosphate dikinase